MYASAFILGFHGCDETVGEAVLAGRHHLEPNTNAHDWLGRGIYFWENSPERAMQWAKFLASRPKQAKRPIIRPFVIGAIIDLGHCLDLTNAASLGAVRASHEKMFSVFELLGLPMPKNEPGHPSDENLLKRNLDCAVLNFLHDTRESQEETPYDSVRGAFFEGKPLYEGAGIMEKTHIQICVRNAGKIRGYFRPQI